MIVLSNFEQSYALASIVRNIRRLGVDAGGVRTEPRVEVLPSQGTSSVSFNMPSQQVPSSIPRDVTGFDPDAYRREMTELVYRRNLERDFSSC